MLKIQFNSRGIAYSYFFAIQKINIGAFRITMALMEDTGWYLPNYAMAEELKWGKGLGCDFAMKSCKEWMDTRTRQKKSIHPYCNKVNLWQSDNPA